MAAGKSGRQIPEATIRLTRIIRAPRAKVFEAWTDPEALKQWWSPPGFETPEVAVDLRVGGSYLMRMRKLPEGLEMSLSGTYTIVRPPEKVAYTWAWDHAPEMGETLVTVEFLERGDSTEIVLTHERFKQEERRKQHHEGWLGCFDRVTRWVEEGGGR